jgi:DNA-binding NtrC family response regulator
MVLKALRRILNTEDFSVICAESAAEALGALANHDIDIIISDQNMPVVSGTVLLQQARELFPRVIRMMLTGSTDIEVAKNAINQGAIWRFFTKPCDDFELITAIKQALKVRNLERENDRLKTSLRAQAELLKGLEEEYPGIADKRVSADGAIIID